MPPQPNLRQTTLLLTGATILTLLFALRPAITNYLNYRQLQTSVATNADRLTTARLQAEAKPSEQASPSSQALVPAIASLASEHHLAVDALPPPRTYTRANASLQLQPVTLRGGAADALEVAYQLEHHRKLARIASLSMRRHQDRNLRREVLLTDITLYQAPRSSD